MEIREIIDRIESAVSTSARLPMGGRTVVHTEPLLELLDQLRDAIPNNIREANQILNMRDNIISQAQMEARRIKASAEEEAKTRTSESQVLADAQRRAEESMLEAQHRAQKMVGDAEKQARARREGADQYAREVLGKLEEELANLQATVKAGVDALSRSGEKVKI